MEGGKYDGILNMPHHVAAERKHMALIDRAAQFAPFAALTGYDEWVAEEARLTDARPLLDDEQKSEIDRGLRRIRETITEHPLVRMTVFVPDARKTGGAYEEICAPAVKLDEFSRTILLEDGRRIPIDLITAVYGAESEAAETGGEW